MENITGKEGHEKLLLSSGEDFTLPVLSTEEATPLNIQPEIATAISNAVGLFLANAPMQAEDVAAGIACEPKQPNTLPAIRAYLPALPGREPIKWRKVGKLPGFIDPRIRNLGNEVFNSFPCFRAFAKECKAEGRDGHASVLTGSDFANGRTETSYLAQVIAKRGEFVDFGYMDHGEAMPGYKPQIAVFMTENWTFKLVRDRIINGAPVNADYIYAWRGGRNFYEPKLERPAFTPPLTSQGAKLMVGLPNG